MRAKQLSVIFRCDVTIVDLCWTHAQSFCAKAWTAIPNQKMNLCNDSITKIVASFGVKYESMSSFRSTTTYVAPFIFRIFTCHVISNTLQWRHNGRDSVPNHQSHDCFLNRLFRHRSKKTSKFRVTGLCAGNSPEAGEFPAQMASNAENVSIWWRHHELFHGYTRVRTKALVPLCKILEQRYINTYH